MNPTNFESILVVPVCIFMFLNLIFLCNIVRVVLLKLNAPVSLQGSCGPSRTVLQAFRFVLLLFSAYVSLSGFKLFVPTTELQGHTWSNVVVVMPKNNLKRFAAKIKYVNNHQYMYVCTYIGVLGGHLPTPNTAWCSEPKGVSDTIPKHPSKDGGLGPWANTITL